MKNASLYFLFVLLFGIAAFAYLNGLTPSRVMDDLFSKKYAYEETQGGVSLVSNIGLPSEILPQYGEKGSFILSPYMLDGTEELNSFMAQALIQDQIVLAGHGKVTTTVIRVYDRPNGSWLGCQTDYGTAKQSEFVSLEACQNLLSSADAGSNSILFSIVFPNEKKASPRIELSENAIIITPVKPTDIPGINFLVLRAIFPDAEKIIQAANKAVKSTQQDSNQTKPKPLDSNILS